MRKEMIFDLSRRTYLDNDDWMVIIVPSAKMIIRCAASNPKKKQRLAQFPVSTQPEDSWLYEKHSASRRPRWDMCLAYSSRALSVPDFSTAVAWLLHKRSIVTHCKTRRVLAAPLPRLAIPGRRLHSAMQDEYWLHDESEATQCTQ